MQTSVYFSSKILDNCFMTYIKEPAQDRSLITQERILDAFEAMLKDHFLDDITVRQIAKQAGITPGALYRRFENKEALLPILYARYEKRLKKWAENIWTQEALSKHPTAENRIYHVVKQHLDFYRANTPMIKTLYLNARTSGRDIQNQNEEERKEIYEQILAPIWKGTHTKPLGNQEEKGRFFILLLLTTIGEKVLFGHQRPAKLLEMSDKVFCAELISCLYNYLLNSAQEK